MESVYPMFWAALLGMVKSSRTGGVMVAIPKFWYKLTKNGNGLKIQMSVRVHLVVLLPSQLTP